MRDVEWPDIKFPPVNLYTMPHQRNWPPQYLRLEAEYCQPEMQQFYDAEEGLTKEALRLKIINLREEFNELWNSRSKG